MEFLSGGYYHCTKEWNREYSSGNGCYKLYFPLAGEAKVTMEGSAFSVKSSNVCFLNGYKLQEQSCPEFMDVFWLHFVPLSLLLNHYLSKAPLFYSWSFAQIPFPVSDFTHIPTLFENPSSIDNKPSVRAGIEVKCRITAIVLYLISDMLSQCGIAVNKEYLQYFERLKPAIDYMDTAYRENLDLEGIASRVNLNPAYFLRLFKQSFHVTPFEYIASKRMNRAWQLVTASGLSVAEISEQLGYCNQFHFSRVFRHYFGMSPLQLRKHNRVP